MTDTDGRSLALFYCQNVPESGEKERQALEKKYGGLIHLFPLPCSGRLDSVHLLTALEDLADAAYLITCPDGTCTYFEGNLRAGKRVERTREIIQGIGLEGERVGIVIGSKENPEPLAALALKIMEKVSRLKPSPALKRRTRSNGTV
ncbi:MAG: hydrogenase iron-sulfur subunit [Proteobacteria bacterium]|nr:hydrogenase iron-sulfur subunit [Pseudomonadota bacterium]